MSEDRDLLERAWMKIAVPEDVMQGLRRRRDRKDRNRRTSVTLLAAVLVALSVGGLMRAFGGSARPAAHPTPTPGGVGIFSHIGGWITYGSSSPPLLDSGASGIWAADPNRQGVRTRLSAKDGEPLGWSSDGTKLLVLRPPKKGPYGTAALYVLNADGSEAPVAHIAQEFLEPGSGGSISPDGSKVVFADDRGSSSNSDIRRSGIYVVDANGGDRRPLLTVAHSELSDPAFSPDGSEIAYFQSRTDFDTTLRVMNADGSGSHVVLKDTGIMKGSNFHPLVWFPDGRRLMFGMGFGPGWIYTVNADGTGLTRVGQGWYPTVSPDGSRIAYGDEAFGLTIEKVDGTHVQHLRSGTPGPWNPLPYEPRSAALSTSSSPGATRPDMITYSIAVLAALSLAGIWLHRKGLAPKGSASKRRP